MKIDLNGDERALLRSMVQAHIDRARDTLVRFPEAPVSSRLDVLENLMRKLNVPSKKWD